jgi:hypothetical protein
MNSMTLLNMLALEHIMTTHTKQKERKAMCIKKDTTTNLLLYCLSMTKNVRIIRRIRQIRPVEDPMPRVSQLRS